MDFHFHSLGPSSAKFFSLDFMELSRRESFLVEPRAATSLVPADTSFPVYLFVCKQNGLATALNHLEEVLGCAQLQWVRRPGR